MAETPPPSGPNPSGPSPVAGTGLPRPAIFANILCAVDGKPGGYAAVRQAASLAGPEGHLTLLAVTSFRSEGAYRSPAISPAKATSIVEQATQIAKEAGVPSTVEVDPAGPPAQVILDWSAGHGLLALGAPSTSWLAGMFIASAGDLALGSFTSGLLSARVQGPESHLLERVVVASDAGEESEQLIELARQLTQDGHSSVVLVHALGHEVGGKRHREERRATVEHQAQRLGIHPGDPSQVRIEPGRAHDVITAAAASEGASLILMGSRRLGGLRAIGSVSRHVVHEAPCSVLLVPPEQPAS